MRDTLEALEKGMVCIAGRNDKETKRREEETKLDEKDKDKEREEKEPRRE